MQRKNALLLILFVSLLATACNPGESSHADPSDKVMFRIPYASDFSSQFVIDGRPDEFAPYLDYQIQADTPSGPLAGQWEESSGDLFFTTTLVIDADYLYFFAEVTDDDLRGVEDVYEAWMGDALEYYIGMYDLTTIGDFKKKKFSRSHGDWRLSFMPTGFFAQDGWLIQDIPGIESVIFPKFSGNGYIVEARINLDALLPDSRNFKVYDGLQFPLKIDVKDQDPHKDLNITSPEKWNLALGSGGVPAASRINDDWQFPFNWNRAIVVGAPPLGKQAKKNYIIEQAPQSTNSEPPVALSPRAFTSLETAISSAAALLDSSMEGAQEGQFPVGSKALLQSAIQQATDFSIQGLPEEKQVEVIANLYTACSQFESSVRASAGNMVDQKATLATRYLHSNLKNQMGHTFLFGMQHATGYGVGWENDDDRSDIKDVCGDYPAIYGEDLREALQGGDKEARLRYRIQQAYERGGVITMSWHQLDYDNRGWNSDRVNYEKIVTHILPGGKRHADYVAKLDLVADFFKSLRGKQGEAIPVIFRPFHEHYGSWFWWGMGQCTTDEFIQLWQFTVEYLKDHKQVHNLLWAISPDLKFLDQGADYFDRFPGDDYVDIYGVDFYYHVPLNQYVINDYQQRLNRVVKIALEHDKIPALTEIGQDGLEDPNWHTRVMINPLKYDSINRHVAYGVTWRNEGTWHFHVPYPGHYTVPDFQAFYDDPFTVFEKDLPDMYALPTKVTKDTANYYVRPENHPDLQAEYFWSNPEYAIEDWPQIPDTSLSASTALFVKDFELSKQPEGVRLIIQFTGGFLLYINGREVFRYNLPGEMELDEGVQPFTTHKNTRAFTFNATALEQLKSGKNRIGIKVISGSSQPLFFDALLETDLEPLFYYGADWSYRKSPR